MTEAPSVYVPPDTGELIEMFGPAPSIVKLFAFTDSTLPALSVAWNCTVCEPLPETGNGPL